MRPEVAISFQRDEQQGVPILSGQPVMKWFGLMSLARFQRPDRMRLPVELADYWYLLLCFAVARLAGPGCRFGAERAWLVPPGRALLFLEWKPQLQIFQWKTARNLYFESVQLV